ncbi:MAG: rod shape-determining protein MreC [bacterium]|nr:rod shape-determining protein MreC [bacterium]
MNYLLKTNKNTRRRFFPILVVLLFLTVVFTLNFLAPRFLGGRFHFVAFPFWKAGQTVSGWFVNSSVLFKEKSELLKELENLREKESDKENLLLLLEVYRKENEELRGISEVRVDEKVILASVLSAPPISPYDTLILGAGLKSGVSEGMIVTMNRAVIGRVVSANDHTSTALLFSAPDERTEVVVGESKIQAAAVGVGGGNMTITLPKGVKIAEGDVVMLSGNFSPRLVGVVEALSSSDADSFQTALLRVPVNFAEARFVEITDMLP